MAINKNFISLAVISLVLCVLMVETTGAVTRTYKRADKQIYAGLTLSYNNIGGDFDGTVYLPAVTEEISVPDLNDGFGFGITLGVSSKVRSFWAVSIETAFQYSSHSFRLFLRNDDAKYANIDFNIKSIYAPKKIQPYLLFGISVPYLNVHNAASSGQLVADAKFRGVGANLGAGFDFFINPRLFFNINAVYRLQEISTVEGVGDRLEITGGLDNNNINVSAGIMYAIPLN